MNMLAPLSRLAYLGQPGTGLGFRLAGLAVYEETDAVSSLSLLQRIKDEKTHAIIFVDEHLVSGQTAALAKLNADPLPAFVLLSNPIEPRHLAVAQINELVIKAVGTDIFNPRH